MIIDQSHSSDYIKQISDKFAKIINKDSMQVTEES